MNPSPESRPGPQTLVWWVLWFAMQTGVFVQYHFLSQGRPVPAGGDSGPWMVALLPLAVSAVMRWVVLGRVKTAAQALPLFIMGIAMAEATNLVGLFVFPAHRLDLFVLSVLGVGQFAPFFAGRYAQAQDGGGR